MRKRSAIAIERMGKETTACFSGYRPQKLPWGFDEECQACLRLKAELLEQIALAYQRGYRSFLSGMAQGVDLYAAEAVLSFQDEHEDAALTCVLPYPTFCCHKPGPLRERYEALLLRSADVKVCSPEYHAGAMMARNVYMIDSSSLLIAVYDGAPGGTQNTVRYAKDRGLDLWLLQPGNHDIRKE